MIQWEQQGFGDQELLAGAAIPYPFCVRVRVRVVTRSANFEVTGGKGSLLEIDTLMVVPFS